ncbi:MAG: UbiA family prenyltransferase [Gammaproteobacteria bacterium]|nr:UbiA family prenyltransferase [Gammaproteobacteria bacterium]MBU1927093.1 UbiA family prenyltransferase [Gammaproteobacteria bacterium]
MFSRSFDVDSTIHSFKKYFTFARCHQPTGSLLLVWPALWALWIAAAGRPSLTLIVVFVLGAFVMHAFASVVDDIADRQLDQYVERTKYRVLPMKQMDLAQAFKLLFFLGCFAFLLVLFLNAFTFLLACVALLLAISYPFSKRYTYWPQLFLGVTTAWSVPMAFAAQLNALPLKTWGVFLIAVAWGVVYDTTYAMMDLSDDQNFGIKSVAVLFRSHTPLFIFVMQLLVIMGMIFLGFALHFSYAYFIFLPLVFFAFLYQQWLMLKKQAYWKAYKNNAWLGALIFCAFLSGYLFV